MPIRIFIVDDHRIMREAVRRILGEHAHLEVVGEAGDSDTAWRGIAALRPDLVFMDLEIPGEGGMALTRRIHAAFPNLKVIVLTSNVDPRLASDALAAGARGYLFKTNGARNCWRQWKRCWTVIRTFVLTLPVPWFALTKSVSVNFRLNRNLR